LGSPQKGRKAKKEREKGLFSKYEIVLNGHFENPSKEDLINLITLGNLESNLYIKKRKSKIFEKYT
jgi:hypothetical protein